MDKIELPQVTLIALTSIKIPETIHAMEISMRGIDFGDVVLVTDKDFYHAKIRHDMCPPMNDINAYNEYCFLHLGEHVKTSHALVVQYDSWILRPQCWEDHFLDFSYIGAPWPVVENSYMANNGERSRVGNGGFSLRSAELMRMPSRKGWPLRQEQGYFNEDGNICSYYRKEFLEQGIKYAPVEVAARFSYENEVLENQGVSTFGFHKNLRVSWYGEVPLK